MLEWITTAFGRFRGPVAQTHRCASEQGIASSASTHERGAAAIGQPCSFRGTASTNALPRPAGTAGESSRPFIDSPLADRNVRQLPGAAVKLLNSRDGPRSRQPVPARVRHKRSLAPLRLADVRRPVMKT